MQKISIVMAAFPEELQYLKDSVESIRRFTSSGTYELIVVNTNASAQLTSWLAEQTDVKPMFFEDGLTLGQAWNQGAQVAIGDSILFIRADTLVTENWLSSLTASLYQTEAIGAVEPLTNYTFGHNPTDEVKFSSFDELLSFANAINSNSPYLEGIATLSGFLMFLKREVFKEVGWFDEKLMGQTMILDYCLRIKQCGWNLGRCMNVFVNHYGGFETGDEKIHHDLFKNKWGFSIEQAAVENRLITLIKKAKNDVFSVLVVGSGIGATNMILQERFPKAIIYGCNPKDNITQVFPYNALDFPSLLKSDQKFDYIILNAQLDIESILPKIANLLSFSGRLLMEMANINYYGIVRNIIKGKGVDLRKKYWKMGEIPGLFQQAGFKELDFDYVIRDFADVDSQFINDMEAYVDQLPQEFEVESFLISAQITTRDNMLHKLFDNLLNDPREEDVEAIFSNEANHILSSLDRYEKGPVVPILNYLGIYMLEKNRVDEVLPYLNRAYEIEPSNSATLINLATVMYKLGEDAIALDWLSKLTNKNGQIVGWMKEIEQNIYLKKVEETRVKFLLRRIENDVDREESSEEIVRLLKNSSITLDGIIGSIMIDIYDKTNTLNRLASKCYSSNEHDYVIPLLEKSYSLDPKNEDTLYNLGYILYRIGAYQDALNFLAQIDYPEDEILDLQKEIVEVAVNDK